MPELDVVLVDDDGDAHGEAVLQALESLGARVARYNLRDVRSRLLQVEPPHVRLRGQGWESIGRRTTVWWRRAGAVEAGDLDDEEGRLARDESVHILHGALASAGVRWVDDPFDVSRAELMDPW